MTQPLFLSGYIPSEATGYCFRLWEKWLFDFKIVKPRKSRLGDFRVGPGKRPAITVNSDLNPYGFLITYLHEVAHCVVFRTYPKNPAPHGKEWKQAFSDLLQPVLTSAVFPENVLHALKRYAVNPKASTGADAALFLALQEYDREVKHEGKEVLFRLSEGASFRFKNRVFLRAELRRTRVLCIDQKTRRKYTLPSHALVEIC